MPSSTPHIKFSTSILVRLGEELNPTPSSGIIELVKNAYDADATSCTIELQHVRKAGGSIILQDNGKGMNKEDIINGWLVLGRSKKNQTETTHLGRIPSGDKGLGRLSALRLGTVAELSTISDSNLTFEHSLKINWDDFNKADLVEDVTLNIKSRRVANKEKPGTKIVINKLRDEISSNEAKRLARALILLADPFSDDIKGFKPKLISSEYSDLERLVSAKYFEYASYHLFAEVNEDGYSSAKVFDWKGEVLFEGDHSEIRSKSPKMHYSCPPASFEMWVFLLDSATFSMKPVTMGEVKEWLSNFGGIHLYYNELRVAPYGDPGNDWLDLNLARARSPEERPSTNTVVGRVKLNDLGAVLKQKTDRAGFIENTAFEDLKKFGKDCTNWLARRRIREAEKRRASSRKSSSDRSNKAKDNVEKKIATMPKEYQKSFNSAFKDFESSKNAEINKLRKEVQLYRTLGTVGITAAVFAHESANNPIKVIYQSLNTVTRRAKLYLADKFSKIESAISRIYDSLASLKVLATVSLELVQHDKRRIGKVYIHDVFNNILSTYDPFLRERETTVTKQYYNGKPYLNGSVASIESIISNFINNSLAAFEQVPPQERNILIKTSISDIEGWIEIRFMDNGPGINGINKDDIWLPGETTRANGTGLGLTIVRDAVTDLGGNIDVIENGELKGAEFIVQLPIIGN